jgi:hypothetical protein
MLAIVQATTDLNDDGFLNYMNEKRINQTWEMVFE